MNRLMSSHKNNNKKSIDHLPFVKYPIFAFFHEEVSMTTRCTHRYTLHVHVHVHIYTFAPTLSNTHSDTQIETVSTQTES